MNFSSNTPLAGSLGIAWIFAVSILTAIVHIAFAGAVLADSGAMWRHLRRKTFFVSGGIWALATLLGGVFVAGVYWLVHHSTLRPQERNDSPTGDSGGESIGAKDFKSEH